MKKKSTYPTLEPKDFSFPLFETWYQKPGFVLSIILRKLIGRPIGSIELKDKGKRRTLMGIGAGLGFKTPECLELLEYHWVRLKTYRIWSVILVGAILALPYFFFVSQYRHALDSLSPRRNAAFVDFQAKLEGVGTPDPVTRISAWVVLIFLFWIVLPFIGMFVVWVVQGTILRIYDSLVGKGYVPSLCVEVVLRLLLFLSRDDALTNPSLRKFVLSHMRYLTRRTMLLPLCYRSPDLETQAKVMKHFKALGAYLRERERWTISPTETTLEDLRRDFHHLAAIYLKGDYGSFKWQDTEAASEPSAGTWRNLLPGFLRFVGMGLPLGLMGAYLWNPDLFPNVPGDSRSVVAFIFIAWLLLSLDVGLKLGIVGQLTSIAKGLKDLK